jgi:hypothetical protein
MRTDPGMVRRVLLAAAGLLCAAHAIDCSSKSTYEPGGAQPGCPVGSESCPCTPGGSCDPGLTCLSNLCVNTGTGNGGSAGGDVGCEPCLRPAFGSVSSTCAMTSGGEPFTATLAFAEGVPSSFMDKPCSEVSLTSGDPNCGFSVQCGDCAVAVSYATSSTPPGYVAHATCSGASGDCPAAGATSPVIFAGAPCTSGSAGGGGAAGTGGAGGASGGGGSGGSCDTVKVPGCADCPCSSCPAGRYCEPGSSSNGVYCLKKCDTDSDCCPGVSCTPNKWTSSYPPKICSNTGL